ncbi:DUF4160 domain-containing protein [Photorhabdus caribbeanensis]|nr:DUF4160 domain-containing protein [Photorhabdus caribbeanensis]
MYYDDHNPPHFHTYYDEHTEKILKQVCFLYRPISDSKNKSLKIS